MMAKYFVTLPVYAEWYGYVEADSEEEAIENFEPEYLCWQCSDHLDVGDDPNWEDARANREDD